MSSGTDEPIIIHMEGGIIQGIVTRSGRLPTRIVVLDYDRDIDEEEATFVPQGRDREPAKASIGIWGGQGTGDKAHSWIADFAEREVAIFDGGEISPPRPDVYGRDWGAMRDEELCGVCGQPDNFAECSHGKLSDTEVELLKGSG